LGEEGIGYISRDGRRLREFNYSVDNGKTTDLDLSILSDDILDSEASFVKAVWQESRSTLWMLSSDYKLYTITLVKESEVAAWAEHEIVANTDGNQVHDIAIIPSVGGTFDDVYLLVGDGQDEKHIMRIGKDYETYCADHNVERILPESGIITNREIEFNYQSTDQLHTARLSSRFDGSHRSGAGLQIGMVVTILSGTLPVGLTLLDSYYVVPASNNDTYYFYTGTFPTGTRVDIGGAGPRTFIARVDQYTTYNAISGLNLLDTTEVEVYGDTTNEGTLEVENNSIVLTNDYEEIYAGFAYENILKTMPIESGQQFGHSTGNITRIDRAFLMFYLTQHAQFGSEENALEDVDSDGTISTFDSRVDFPQNPDRRNYLIVKGKGIHLMTLLGATLRGVSYDG